MVKQCVQDALSHWVHNTTKKIVVDATLEQQRTVELTVPQFGSTSFYECTNLLARVFWVFTPVGTDRRKTAKFGVTSDALCSALPPHIVLARRHRLRWPVTTKGLLHANYDQKKVAIEYCSGVLTGFCGRGNQADERKYKLVLNVRFKPYEATVSHVSPSPAPPSVESAGTSEEEKK
jgi:hypothetical protein